MDTTLHGMFGLALTLAGIASFSVLAAGVQVPHRLGWREDLAKLTPFNRSLMWVYYGFIGGTIVGFGALTLGLRAEMLAGDRAALALAGFMGLWWTCRIAVDLVVFRHADWPRGRGFVVGHVLLTATFVLLAATYLGLVAWHLAGGAR